MYRTLYPSIDYPAYTVMLEDENSQKSYKNIDHLLKLAQQEVNTYEKSFAELKNTVEACKVRFEYTPSIYPLSSSFVLSEFGWRNHPIIHRVRFHTGVDLPTWQSAPIFATASGVVTKAGWMAGYGNRVEIDHGYGYSTVYAHNALITVGVGQHIRKGQIIARAGMTGLAQGVHCHYEVRFFDRPVNPDRFLNLTIFTASKNW
jgi:murein DD-endopeptidase MepM/ murein hydrolase activator NlpD